ncbi:MAG: alpha/beta hydrolase [Actinomycetota bacterium]|nr:alpha/beta hydrolase [Actinomycetota bacterium]
MTKAQANGIDIEFDVFGDRENPAIILIMGLGAQMIAWPVKMCNELAESGFFVVRFDNRDCGLSTKFDSFGVPNIFAGMAGDASTAAYSLIDMADDVVGLMDFLEVKAAHVVGISMGGMIAQQAVIDHPKRFMSLCSIMANTGATNVGQPSPEIITALLKPGGRDRETSIAAELEMSRVISSERYFDREKALELVTRSYDRCFSPDGMIRQLMAILVSPERTKGLEKIALPTLVIHGLADKLVDPSGGYATASAIPDSKILTFEGMAHELPEAVWREVRDAIHENIFRAANRP